MNKRNNVYEFDPKKRRSKTHFDGERVRLNRKKKKDASDRSYAYENLVRKRRIRAFAIFAAFVLAIVLAGPIISSLTVGR
ncbi:MAG: hypothetical protein U1D96_10145 [Eubacteriales bacterium]|jgi:hypothetical protein|nr:hypothetical protein [Bacillota bacterium]MBV1727106.1 hypothetical protein [Desulforudis sp.]MDQ7789432.1 hypothetical protein [Clostridia bacterium]MDZ4043820.1 hypothetical protein [Eubacteriales bacterium]MBV1735263.1 hypothetical protein [Desulforudis sp.]